MGMWIHITAEDFHVMISYPCVSNLSLPMRKESNEEEQQQLAQVYLMLKGLELDN